MFPLREFIKTDVKMLQQTRRVWLKVSKKDYQSLLAVVVQGTDKDLSVDMSI